MGQATSPEKKRWVTFRVGPLLQTASVIVEGCFSVRRTMNRGVQQGAMLGFPPPSLWFGVCIKDLDENIDGVISQSDFRRISN